jgi:hypothetical protein
MPDRRKRQMNRQIEPLVLEGALHLEIQEGGYAWDAVMIDKQHLDRAIRDHIGAKSYGSVDAGPVRIEIVFVCEDDRQEMEG